MVTVMKGVGFGTINLDKESILMPMETLKKSIKVLIKNGKMASLFTFTPITPSMRAATSTTKDMVEAR